MSNISINLMYLNKPIYCEKSNKDANPFLIRVLAKEEKDRQAKMSDMLSHIKSSPILPVVFDSTSVSCGIWAYDNLDLVFTPQATWDVKGTAKFGERSMILKLDTGLRIDFRYSSTLEITTEDGSTPSFVFSMKESLMFYETISDDSIVELMAILGLQTNAPHQTQARQNGPERHRLPCLNYEHKPIAGCCLVYRIALTNLSVRRSGFASEVGECMQDLRKAHGIPSMIHRRIDIYYQPELYTRGFVRLQQTLSSLNVGLPFVVNFQIQKLAQNGYLSPNMVLLLLPEIKKVADRSSMQTCANAVRKLCNQIDFPGSEKEAVDFELDTIINLLKDNEKQCKMDGLALVQVAHSLVSGNVAIIHRAKVTPAGIYLSGPEPETNNRVLRKYPGHHEYFLQVQFCDEDGQPVRFNPRVSNQKIYHERFKDILNSGIHIGGRKYAFLGFSHSSLRAQSCWFMAPFMKTAFFTTE